AVPGLPARRDADAVAGRQGKLSRPVYLEPRGQLGRRHVAIAQDQPRSLRMAFRVLMELEHVARIILRLVGFLGFGHVGREPYAPDAFLAELAPFLEPSANRTRDAIRLRVRWRHHERRLLLPIAFLFGHRREITSGELLKAFSVRNLPDPPKLVQLLEGFAH